MIATWLARAGRRYIPTNAPDKSVSVRNNPDSPWSGFPSFFHVHDGHFDGGK
jgi:hypothetical protein